MYELYSQKIQLKSQKGDVIFLIEICDSYFSDIKHYYDVSFTFARFTF